MTRPDKRATRTNSVISLANDGHTVSHDASTTANVTTVLSGPVEFKSDDGAFRISGSYSHVVDLTTADFKVMSGMYLVTISPSYRFRYEDDDDKSRDDRPDPLSEYKSLYGMNTFVAVGMVDHRDDVLPNKPVRRELAQKSAECRERQLGCLSIFTVGTTNRNHDVQEHVPLRANHAADS